MPADDERETMTAPSTAAASTGGQAPTRVGGRYEILGLLGVGGMGSVYRARDRELDETVALKMLRRDLVELPGMLERFRREVKLARRVTHRNVARTFDIGEHEGEKYLTMEYVEGESLAALIERHGMLPVSKIVEVAEPILDGMAAAHAAGVIHRDLKPDNVLLARDGRVVITDFGVARGFEAGSSTATMGAPIGTPAYMAPEQVEGAEVIDARADLYAFGVMLFEMATGERPFRGGSALAVAMARMTQPVPDPRPLRADLPDPLVDVMRRCMARKRDDRPSSAREVLQAVQQVTRPPSAPTPPPRAQTPSSAGDASAKAVAVLPFRNGGPPADDYLADGLTDDLIDTLSMARGLRVRSRGAVESLRGAERDPRQIGRELEVQVVVEGTVRRAGEQLRVSTRVVSVADGFQLWAKRFDRPAAEVLQVADEAARAIAEALTVESAPKRQGPSDPEALDLYLRARHLQNRYGPDHSRQAIALYEQAVARAPDDPLILSGYAMELVRRWFFGGEDAEAARAKAVETARRASELAPERPEPRVALASILYQSGDVVGSARELKRVLVGAPHLADAHEMLGRILVQAGRVDRAERHLYAALAVEPTMAGATMELARLYALRGDWARSDDVMARAVHADALGRWLMAMRLALWRKDMAVIERALAETETFDEKLRQSAPLQLLSALVRERKAPTAEFMRRIVSDGPDSGRRRLAFFYQLIAECTTWAGDEASALDAIDRSIESGLIDVVWMDCCPLLAPLRAHPRFLAQRAQVAARATPICAASDAN